MLCHDCEITKWYFLMSFRVAGSDTKFSFKVFHQECSVPSVIVHEDTSTPFIRICFHNLYRSNAGSSGKQIPQYDAPAKK